MSPRSSAAATIARASGCSLLDSTPPASRSTCASSSSAEAATPVTTCRPLVSVPVLSNSTTSMDRIRSNANRSLIRIPARAETAVDSETTSGMASPSAWGQAMTSTVTVRTTALSRLAGRHPGHEGDQPGDGGDVEQQGGEPVGQGLGPTAAGLGLGHESLDAGQGGVLADGLDLDPDGRVGRHRSGHDPVIDVLGTGRDSPVIMDSSSAASPSAIDTVGRNPPPGADEHDVARREVSTETTVTAPSSPTRSASSGSSSARAAKAPWA